MGRDARSRFARFRNRAAHRFSVHAGTLFGQEMRGSTGSMKISAWTRVRTAAGLASVVFVFAVAFSIEFASLASAKPGYTVFPGGRSQSFQVRASKGYTLFVRSIGRNRILVNADSREADV